MEVKTIFLNPQNQNINNELNDNFILQIKLIQMLKCNLCFKEIIQ